MHYYEAYVKVKHPGDFVSLLSARIAVPSILTSFTLVGNRTRGLFVLLSAHREQIDLVLSLAQSLNIIKEISVLSKKPPILFIDKLSFGIQRALIELNVPKPNIIYHDEKGNKHFRIVIAPHEIKNLIHKIKENARAVGDEVSALRIRTKPLSPKYLYPFDTVDMHISMNLQGTKTPGDLTSIEHLTLWRAYTMGFFEWPKRCSLDDLSRALGLSRATVLEHLRKALKKVVGEYFARNYNSEQGLEEINDHLDGDHDPLYLSRL